MFKGLRLLVLVWSGAASAQQVHCKLVGIRGSHPNVIENEMEPMNKIEQAIGRGANRDEVLNASVVAASKILGVPRSIDREAGIIHTAEWLGGSLVYECTSGGSSIRMNQDRRYWATILALDEDVIVSPHCMAQATDASGPPGQWQECSGPIPAWTEDMKIFRMLAQTAQWGAEIKAAVRTETEGKKPRPKTRK